MADGSGIRWTYSCTLDEITYIIPALAGACPSVVEWTHSWCSCDESTRRRRKRRMGLRSRWSGRAGESVGEGAWNVAIACNDGVGNWNNGPLSLPINSYNISVEIKPFHYIWNEPRITKSEHISIICYHHYVKVFYGMRMVKGWIWSLEITD